MIPMLTLINGWELVKLSSKKRCRKDWLHIEGMRPPKNDILCFQVSLPYFTYHIPDSSKLFSFAHEVEKVECSGIIKQKHSKESHNLRGGGQDTPIVVPGGGTYTRTRPRRYNNTTI
jgi:hypothetical protein